MNLQQHAGLVISLFQGFKYAVHCHFDNIGGTALYRGVYGGTLGIHGQAFVFVVNAVHGAFAAKRGKNIAVFAGKLNGVVHIFFNLGHFAEIGINISFGLFIADIDLFGKAVLGNAVNNAEVYCLSMAALVRGHLVQRHAEHAGSRGGVNILIFGKGVFQAFYVGHHRQQPQFYLRIVRGNQFAAGTGDKTFTDFFALFAANRNILQIGVIGGQAPG